MRVAPLGDRQFAWFDRGGRLLAAVGPRNDFNSPFTSFSLSPNERYLIVQRHDDPDTVLPTIWVIDLEREGSVFRFTETDAAEPEFNPVWSPDGCEILFSRGDDRNMRLLRRSLTGGTPTCVLETPGPKFLTDWSANGDFVTFGSQWPEYRSMHTWILPLGESNGPQQAWAFLQHSYVECGARFSPRTTGKAPSWIAYTSNETGHFEVYLRDFPQGGCKWQVSAHGGWNPCWRPDGRELFYLTTHGTLMAVALDLSASLDPGNPQPLFETGLRLSELNIWSTQYAVSRDGERFLLNRRPARAEPAPLTAVVPW